MRSPALLPLLRLCAAVAACLLIFDVLLFRSGVYFSLIKPTSTAGSVVSATMAIDRWYMPGRRNVLVLGNSQIGEGFSAKTADRASGRENVHFLNGSIPGTSLRVWHYLLREIDPDADRFAAIAMMVDYDLAGYPQDMTNYPLDTNYLTPLLRSSDVFDYPRTFTHADQQEKARRAILFPLQALHEDAQELLLHPLRRLHELRRFRPAWLDSLPEYGGREAALPDLPIDPQSGMPRDWNGEESRLRPMLENYFRGLRTVVDADLQSANTVYQREWLGRICERYAAHGVPIVVFAVPRGPWQRELTAAPQTTGAVAEFARSGRVMALPADAFTDLEEPRYFFDALHMNHTGRERFSQEFAARLANVPK